MTEARRAEILSASIEAFSEDGYRSTDVQSVADRLGIAKGTVYLYFGSKAELYRSAVDAALEALAGNIEAATLAEATPTAQLRAVVQAYVTFFREEPHLAELILRQHGEAVADAQRSYLEMFSRNAHRLEELVVRGMEAGEFRTLPPKALTRVLANLLHGTLFETVHGPALKGEPLDSDLVVDLLLEGISDRGGSA